MNTSYWLIEENSVVPAYYRGFGTLTVQFKNFKPSKPLQLLSFSMKEDSSELYYTNLFPHIEKIFKEIVTFPEIPMKKYFCNLCGFMDTPHKIISPKEFGRCGICSAPSEHCYGIPVDPFIPMYSKAKNIPSPTNFNLTKKFETVEELEAFNQARMTNGVFQL